MSDEAKVKNFVPASIIFIIIIGVIIAIPLIAGVLPDAKETPTIENSFTVRFLGGLF